MQDMEGQAPSCACVHSPWTWFHRESSESTHSGRPFARVSWSLPLYETSHPCDLGHNESCEEPA